MKYERLTDREIAKTLKNTVKKNWESDSLEAQCYIRLAEIEDKIESGELIDRKQSDTVREFVRRIKEIYDKGDRLYRDYDIVDLWTAIIYLAKEYDVELEK